eukprot:1216380-Prymnesium_polylepis.4
MAGRHGLWSYKPPRPSTAEQQRSRLVTWLHPMLSGSCSRRGCGSRSEATAGQGVKASAL